MRRQLFCLSSAAAFALCACGDGPASIAGSADQEIVLAALEQVLANWTEGGPPPARLLAIPEILPESLWPDQGVDPELGEQRFELARQRLPNLEICPDHPDCLAGPFWLLVGLTATRPVDGGVAIGVIEIVRWPQGELYSSSAEYTLRHVGDRWTVVDINTLVVH